MLRRLRKDQEGFTLMEIVIVIVILGILALLAVPRLLGFTDQARIANDKEYAAIVGKSAELYWASHNEAAVSITDMADGSILDALVDPPETTLQYDSGSAAVDVVVSDGTEVVSGKLLGESSTAANLPVDRGVAVITITYDTSGDIIEYSSQYGYSILPDDGFN